MFYNVDIADYNQRNNKLNKTDFALIVIEMQEAFRSDELCLISQRQIDNVNRLLRFTKENKQSYIVRHNDTNSSHQNMVNWWGSGISINSNDWNIIPEVDLEGAVIIDKTQYSAFFETNLECMLKDAGINDLIISGNMTNCCCETTARDAFMRGFNVFFVNDATATVNADLHTCTIKNLAFGFASIVNTSDIIE